MDKILVKSATLQRYSLKLNPSKCIFGIKSRCFPNHLVIKQGIEANLEKVLALQEMSPPQEYP